MNKAIITIFLATLTALLMLSSHNTFAGATQQRNGAPPAQIVTAQGVINVDSLAQGRHVTITYWSSRNAASRLENLQRAAQARRDSSLIHIGLNIDDSPEIYRQYLLRDNLQDDPTQFQPLHASAHL